MSNDAKDLANPEDSQTPDIIIRTNDAPSIGSFVFKCFAIASVAATLLWARASIKSMELEQTNLQSELAQLQTEFAELSSELKQSQSVQEALRQQIIESRLKKDGQQTDQAGSTTPTSSAVVSDQQLESRKIIRTLKPGLYTVTADVVLSRVRRSGTIDEKLTIYHITSPLSSTGADAANMFNIGLAIGSLASGPQLYIDYDADGKVDAEMLYDFVSLVPYSGFLAKSLSEDNSQRTYDALAQHVEQAEFLSLDEIETKGSGVARALWDFVSSQSSRLLAWVQKQKPKSVAPATESGGVAPSGQNTF